jgi:hypothetical protein
MSPISGRNRRPFSSGITAQLQPENASGSRICDQMDQTAIEKAQLFYVPTQEAEVVADFGSSSAIADSAKPLISPERPQVSIVLPADKHSPPVSFVEYSGSFHQQFNNAGIIQLLHGDNLGAERSFEEALKCDANYQPAAHNLALVKSLRNRTSLPP